MSIDVNQLAADMRDAASHVLDQDIAAIRGFEERQLKAIAQQAAFVETGILSGQITDETRDFFLDGLEDMALNFVKTLRGLLTVTVEKVWNAVVGVIWAAIKASTGISLPVPNIH